MADVTSVPAQCVKLGLAKECLCGKPTIPTLVQLVAELAPTRDTEDMNF